MLSSIKAPCFGTTPVARGLQDLAEWRELLTKPPQTRFLAHTNVRSARTKDGIELGFRQEYSHQKDRGSSPASRMDKGDGAGYRRLDAMLARPA
jgi:hypothetical protein